MKINEVANPLQTYLASVRVVLQCGRATARTTVTADNVSLARAMLTRIYGLGNVYCVSPLMLDAMR